MRNNFENFRLIMPIQWELTTQLPHTNRNENEENIDKKSSNRYVYETLAMSNQSGFFDN